MELFSIPTTSVAPVTNERWTDKFERQAMLNPANPAVISGDQTMSYGELHRRSNEIANLLRESGIGRGSFVGLGLHRCLELPAALLGILKCGAAYVPLDPGYPPARIQQMIESAQLTHVITQQELAGQFPQVRLIYTDTPTPPDPVASDACVEKAAGDFIVTIATSGSTAQPQAATIDQHGLRNPKHWYSIKLHLGSSDPTLAISSPSFDLTRKNFFDPLVTGGTLVLDDCQTHDVSRISSLILQHGITLIHCTPSAFYPLVDAAAADDYKALATVRVAALGGEPIAIPRLRAWLESANCGAEVVNSYGPTECTDCGVFHRLHRGNLDDFPSSSEIQNVPDGEIGERFLAGAATGGGHRNDLSRTQHVSINSIDRTGDPRKGLPSNILEFRGSPEAPTVIDIRFADCTVGVTGGTEFARELSRKSPQKRQTRV